MEERLGKLKQENARDIAASNATRSLRLINNPGLDERTKGEALSRLRADFFGSFLKSSVGGKVETRTYVATGGKKVDVSGVALGPDVHIWNVAGLDAALDRGYFTGDTQREQELNNIRDRYVWGAINTCFKNEKNEDAVDPRLVNIVRSGASRDVLEERIRQELLGGNMSPVRGAEGYILEEYKERQEAQNNNTGPDNRGNQGGPDVNTGRGQNNPDNQPQGGSLTADAIGVAVARALRETGVGAGQEQRSESDFSTFVNAEFTQQPIQLQVDTFPPSWFKNPPERFIRAHRGRESQTVADWQQLIRARINLTNAAYVKNEIAAVDGEKAKQNSFLKLSEKELRMIYSEPGVRWAMERIVSDIFVRSNESPGYFWKIKTDSSGKIPKALLEGFQDHLFDLADELNRSGIPDVNEVQAKAAVAMAWNVLHIGNSVESADSGRNVPPTASRVYGEQIRAMFHPEDKAERKYGIKPTTEEESRSLGTEEGWGGKTGIWFSEMMTFGDTRPKFIRQVRSGELKPFPTRIGASLPELLEVSVVSGRGVDGRLVMQKMSMAQALSEGKEIQFQNIDASLFGSYGDNWDTFWKYYLYSSGKSPVDIKKFDDWTSSLADILAKMRGIKEVGKGDEGSYLFEELFDADRLRWIILNSNSTGIERASYPIMKIGDDGAYVDLVDWILRSPRVCPSKSKRLRVKELLFARKIADNPLRPDIATEDKIQRSKIRMEASFRSTITGGE